MSQDAFRSIVRSVLGVLFVSATALLAIEMPLGSSLTLCSFMTLSFVILAVVDRRWTALIGIATGALELALYLAASDVEVKEPLDALAMIIAVGVGLIVAWLSRAQRTEIWRLYNEIRGVAAANHVIEERLNELSHRITNDFSMLVETANSIGRRTDDPETRSGMRELSARVIVLGRIYRRLRSSDSGGRTVNVRSYFQELCDDLQFLRFNGQTIELSVDVEDVGMPLRSATLLGLITNELLTNVHKHAFLENRGLINVTMRRAPPEMMVLEVIDDGVGFSQSITQSAGEGHRLLIALAGQLCGAISFSRIADRTVVSVSFPMDSANVLALEPIAA